MSSNKQNLITGSDKSIIPSKEGVNIASVLFNWSKSYPEIFSEIKNDLKEFFPFIKELRHSREEIPYGGVVDILTFDEENVGMPIKQYNWSAGVYRILWLLMSTKVPFSDNTKPPSLILIDEIENGLDFKNLKYIISYFQDYSDNSQIVMSSHSPLVCDFVHPSSWIIAKRKGCQINFISPKSVEGDIESQLELFKHRHWDFYTKHISNSKLYNS